ncbi:MAG TPA: YCF48-related protein [Bryobacteraceae bacterium]|nr:YCF48-related protein [Bryobacteraceae bacterium]
MTHLRLAAWLLITCTAALAGRLELKFFHDEEGEQLEFRQISFVSPRRGLAIGTLQKGSSRQPLAMVTTDGGQSWTRSALPAEPYSMYCLKDSSCWLVTNKGIYISAESGTDWKRISREKFITRVWFNSLQRGWAIGARRKIVETRDGGKTWTPIAALQDVKSSENRTVFHDIVFFDGKHGLITGRSERLEPEEVPIWLDADPTGRRESPTLSVVLQTTDGGETWKTSTTSMFGRLSELDGHGQLQFAVAVVEFDRYFNFPSEVYRINLKTGANDRVLRMKDFAVTDVVVLPDGRTLAAGFRPSGLLARTPVPGKVRVMETTADMELWRDIDVDYRALGHRATLAYGGAAGLWVATDGGMLLKLVP